MRAPIMRFTQACAYRDPLICSQEEEGTTPIAVAIITVQSLTSTCVSITPGAHNADDDDDDVVTEDDFDEIDMEVSDYENAIYLSLVENNSDSPSTHHGYVLICDPSASIHHLTYNDTQTLAGIKQR